MIPRRIIPRDELLPNMRCERAAVGQLTCHATITLDGTRYQCGRGVIGGHHDGIHDAFVVHEDDGAVRW